jgi:ubiquinone/menaquinone biosynthesis C-methylase UbiE
MSLSHRRSPASMRAFYNRFWRLYPAVEKSVDPILDEVARDWIARLPGVAERTALEYACGSGSFSIVLGRHFRSVVGRDASEGMLARARMRAEQAGVRVAFRQGDILAVDEPDDSFDHVFVSFALHLFNPEQIAVILRRLLEVARESVVIVDHPKKWSLGTAFMEWIEGSYYDRYIRMDFTKVAQRVGAGSFTEWEIDNAAVMVFSKRP